MEVFSLSPEACQKRIGDRDDDARPLQVVVRISLTGSGRIRVINRKAVVACSNICRHGIEQRPGDVIAGVVSVEGTVKGAQCIARVCIACYTRLDAVLVIGLPHEYGFRTARAISSLRSVNVKPDAGDHLVGKVHADEADNADIVVAGIVEFLAGVTVLGVGGRIGMPCAQGRGIGYCGCHGITS